MLSVFSSCLVSTSSHKPLASLCRSGARLCALCMSLTALLLAGTGASFAAELVNINAADVESIANALLGIGPAKAQAIVDYREEFGAFTQIQDVTRVPGIGEATLDQIRSLITLDGADQ